MLRYTLLAGLAGCVAAIPVAPTSTAPADPPPVAPLAPAAAHSFFGDATDPNTEVTPTDKQIRKLQSELEALQRPADDRRRETSPDDEVHARHARAVCSTTGCMWDNAMVSYRLDISSWPANKQPTVRSLFARALAEYELRTVVRFRPQQAGDTHTVVIQNGDGTRCDSNAVGSERSSITINLGWCWNDYSAHMHELAHAIGVWHEQQRFDRGTYLNVGATSNADTANWAVLGFEDDRETSNGVPYDFGSVMHYPLTTAAGDVSFTAAGRALWQGQGSPSIGNAATISMGDVLTIDTMYAAATVGLSRETDLTIQVGETLSGNTATNGVHFFGNPAPDVAHRFVVPAAGGKYQFSTCGSAFDTYLRVFNAEWVEIARDDDSGPCGVQTVLTTGNLAAGTYWLVVDGYSTASGAYSLTMAGGATSSGTVFQPSTANQGGSGCASEGGSCHCNGMIRYGAGSMWTAKRSNGVTSCTNGVFGDPSYGTRKSCQCYPDTARTGDTSGDGKVTGSPAPDNAYLIRVPAGGARYEVDTCASSTNFDTYLRIMGVDGRELARRDDGGCSGSNRGLQSKLSTPLLAAGDHWVVVDGWSTRSGLYSLSTNFAPTQVQTHRGSCGYSQSCASGYTRVATSSSGCFWWTRRAVCTRIV